MFPPQAFIIGAQKSGTTSLAYLLNQHPMICVATPKEPDFLTVNWDRGLDWYRSCFRQPKDILVDASVSYTMAQLGPDSAPDAAVVPRRAFEMSPDAKFIYIVRSPAERCYSAYLHDVRAGREKRPLRQAIEEGAYYASASLYFSQLKAFLSFFPFEQFLILDFEDFTKDPRGVVRRCFQFLGATPHDFPVTISEPKNQAFLYNRLGLLIRDTFGENRLKYLGKAANAVIPSGLKPAIKRALYAKPPSMTVEDRAWLTALFQDDAAAFERLTGVRFGK